MISREEISRVARILVVDNDPVSVQLFTTMLKRGGYQHIWSTDDPERAIELFREVKPDLVLLDLHMTPLDGLEVLRRLREESPAAVQIPVMLITGDASDQARLNALLSGAHDFITKPIDLVETMLRIRTRLETRFQFVEMERTIDRLRGPYG
jgi:putative two-component system response regulator